MPDAFSADNYNLPILEKALEELGYEFVYLSETDSTMNLIQKYAEKGSEAKIFALTDHQTQGAGRTDRSWLDIANNSLMFSALFKIPQNGVAFFADMAAMTICDVLKLKTGADVKIKYPNDLVVNDMKTGGILVKNLYNEKMNYLGTNLGLGVNVHYDKDQLGKFQTDYPATSLDSVTGAFCSRQEILMEIAKVLRFLSVEIKVILENPNSLKKYDEKWVELSNVMGREIVILKSDRIVDQGLVVDTAIGRGVELKTAGGTKWFSLFESDMKVRIA